MIKILKSVNDQKMMQSLEIDENSNEILARFQKITSQRLRAMDNKIEIVDQLLKDLDEQYSKTSSILSDIENKNNENILKRKNKQESDLEKTEEISNEENIYDIKELTEKINKLEQIQNESVQDNNKTIPEKIEQKRFTPKDEEIVLDKKSRILLMHNQGMKPEEIGKKLGIGTGEVMLVINLNEQ